MKALRSKWPSWASPPKNLGGPLVFGLKVVSGAATAGGEASAQLPGAGAAFRQEPSKGPGGDEETDRTPLLPRPNPDHAPQKNACASRFDMNLENGGGLSRF